MLAIESCRRMAHLTRYWSLRTKDFFFFFFLFLLSFLFPLFSFFPFFFSFLLSSFFLVACTQLYKPLCWLVCRSVCLSVCLSLKARSTRLMAIGLVSAQAEQACPNTCFQPQMSLRCTSSGYLIFL